MATCLVSGIVLDPSGTAVNSAPVSFNVQTPTISTDPVQASTTTDSNGQWSLSLQQSISGVFTIEVAPSITSKRVLYSFSANIPSSSTATFSSTLVGS
jgi:hypothetical protein